MIEQAKAAKKEERFHKYVGTLLHLWFYQYTECFHCRPETIDDLFFGLRYLHFTRTE